MPKLAAFPKAYMQALCKDGSMTLAEWFQLATTLDIDGLEFYAGFIEMKDETNWPLFRRQVEDLYKGGVSMDLKAGGIRRHPIRALGGTGKEPNGEVPINVTSECCALFLEQRAWRLT